MKTYAFHHEYRLYEGQYRIEDQMYVGYGISIFDTDSGKELLCIEDITISKEKITSLIKQCNEKGLSPIHIYDVIEDFLS